MIKIYFLGYLPGTIVAALIGKTLYSYYFNIIIILIFIAVSILILIIILIHSCHLLLLCKHKIEIVLQVILAMICINQSADVSPGGDVDFKGLNYYFFITLLLLYSFN